MYSPLRLLLSRRLLLVRSYKVTRYDTGDDDGISVAEDKLSLPAGASIRDSWGNDATLDHDALAAQPLPSQVGHKVDGSL